MTAEESPNPLHPIEGEEPNGEGSTDVSLAKLLEETDVPAVVFDKEFTIQAANPAFDRMLQPRPRSTKRGLRGKNFLNTLESPSVESVRRLRNLRMGERDQVQVWHKVPGRDLLPVEYSFVVLEGSPRLLGGFARDRTSDLLLIEQLAHLYDELEQRHQELKRLHRKIERLADTDELTALANRRAFDAGFDREWRRFMRTGKPLSLILLDVDHFKQVNDRYGHVRGDYVLQSIGHVLKEQVRATDVCARYGGEEFAIVLPETDAEHALQIAERLLSEVRELDLHLADDKCRVTLSAGVATAGSEFKPSDRLVLFVAADSALRLAKQRGRDRVETH